MDIEVLLFNADSMLLRNPVSSLYEITCALEATYVNSPS